MSDGNPDPKVGDLLPEDWSEWVLEWKKWDDEGVPKEIQEYIDKQGEGDRHTSRCLGIGRHTDGRFFIVEVFDQGNSQDYFAGWWKDDSVDESV